MTLRRNNEGRLVEGRVKRIDILGVNGNARDLLETIREIWKADSSFPEPGGFLDDRIEPGTLVDGLPVLGPISAARNLKEAVFINAIGSPTSHAAKPAIIAGAGVADDRFFSVLHPSVVCSASALVGVGSAVLSHTSIGSAVRIGRHVMVLQNCVISHDSEIQDFAVLATGVCLSGGVKIGRGAYIGSNSCIRGDLTVGEGALVGMGSVVLTNIPTGEGWCGNPARRLHPAQMKG